MIILPIDATQKDLILKINEIIDAVNDLQPPCSDKPPTKYKCKCGAIWVYAATCRNCGTVAERILCDTEKGNDNVVESLKSKHLYTLPDHVITLLCEIRDAMKLRSGLTFINDSDIYKRIIDEIARNNHE